MLLGLLVACIARPPPASVVVPADRGWPATRRDGSAWELRGRSILDPYLWLEDAGDPAVAAWTLAQDAYARRVLATPPRREAFAERLRELSDVEAIGPSVHRGGRAFYLHRRPGTGVTLEWSDAAGAHTLLPMPQSATLAGWVPSPDGRFVAWIGLQANGDAASLHVTEAETGRELEAIDGARYATPDWLPDGTGFVYERVPTDSTLTPGEVATRIELRQHTLGADPADDPVLHAALGPPARFLDGQLAADGHTLFLSIEHGDGARDLYTRELHGGEWRPIPVGGATFLQARDGVTYAFTNAGAPRFRVLTRPTDGDGPWTERVPEPRDAVLRSATLLGDTLALVLLRDGADELQLLPLGGGAPRAVALPGPGTLAELVGQPGDPHAELSWSTFTTPMRTFDLDVRTGVATPRAPARSTDARVERVWATSHDGIAVPLWVVHRPDVKADGARRVLLTAYGGFGTALTPAFRPSAAAWVEAGGVYAVAGVRGGGELGSDWHRAGMGAGRLDAIEDVVAAAARLVRDGWTGTGRIGLLGRSNGALLAAGAVTRHPEAWGAMVGESGLYDLLRYPRLGVGSTWVGEFGDPDDPTAEAWLRAWSPYHAVRTGTAYPPALLTASGQDDRVDPAHSRKLTAALQYATTGGVVLLRTDADGGHTRDAGLEATIARTADELGFLWEGTGPAEP